MSRNCDRHTSLSDPPTARPGNPRPAAPGPGTPPIERPRFLFAAESGNGDSLFPSQVPDSRAGKSGNTAAGTPRFPKKNREPGGREIRREPEPDFLMSDEHQLQWTRNHDGSVLSRE